MANPETVVQQEIRLGVQKALPCVRLFRNECGVGYHIPREEMRKIDKKKIRRVSYGLTTGSSDLIGFRVLTVTPEMVGSQIAQFVGCEVKTEEGTLEPEQKRWKAFLEKSGALAIVARSPEEAIQKLNPAS